MLHHTVGNTFGQCSQIDVVYGFIRAIFLSVYSLIIPTELRYSFLPDCQLLMIEIFAFTAETLLLKFYVKQNRVSHKSLNFSIHRIFDLMMNILSHLTNFQSILCENNSLKINQLLTMNSTQFDSIFTFTFIDMHLRMSNKSIYISDIDEVAHVERLLKFERLR